MNERTHTQSESSLASHRAEVRTFAAIGAAFVCGLVLACGLVAPIGALSPRVADGQSGTALGDDEGGSGRVSAAEQRKEMIVLLKNMSTRMDRIEAALVKGINVKVTDMPAMRMDGAGGREPRDAKQPIENSRDSAGDPVGGGNPPTRMAPKQPMTTVRPKP